MPGLDGFGVIKRLLDKKIPLPKIVFATAFDQYAVKAFEVNAVDYLLKPFDKKRVAQAIQKAKAQQDAGGAPSEKFETLVRMLESQKQPVPKVLLKALGRMFLVDQKDICYAWIEDGVISVVTAGVAGMEGQSNCRTLEELLDTLDPKLFWRAHRSYLVNINRIREVVPWFRVRTNCGWTTKSKPRFPSAGLKLSACGSCSASERRHLQTPILGSTAFADTCSRLLFDLLSSSARSTAAIRSLINVPVYIGAIPSIGQADQSSLLLRRVVQRVHPPVLGGS